MARAWLNNEPLAYGDFGSSVITAVPLGTTLTNVNTVSNLQPGSYRFNSVMPLINVGSPTQTTMTLSFSGASVNVFYRVHRYTATTIVPSVHTAFGVSTGTAAACVFIESNGMFTVTSVGAFTVGGTRTGGTSSTAQPGSYIALYQIA